MSSAIGSIKHHPQPRKPRKRARSLRKSLLTFASGSSPTISIHAPKPKNPGAATAAAAAITDHLAISSRIADGASSSLNNSEASYDDDDDEDEDALSSPPLMMRDASVASRGSARIPRSFRRVSSSRVDPADTVWWGWVVLVTTWVVFVVGMGSVLGIWDWAWHGASVAREGGDGEEGDPDDDVPIPGYYPALVILTWVVAWVWVVVAWVGMKYFRHARVAPAN
ncbi:hypothetical protein Dda_2692 [Drechslerella dactyloides]|uniref:Uncharacterized protein n=1 Tax=Drechslerella dactyloides TaxID=74499 RepID=A0AAD6NM68_DREDA|nr:hypothetical protein Dda_2692 [Drechslerella dactyloides]